MRGPWDPLSATASPGRTFQGWNGWPEFFQCITVPALLQDWLEGGFLLEMNLFLKCRQRGSQTLLSIAFLVLFAMKISQFIVPIYLWQFDFPLHSSRHEKWPLFRQIDASWATHFYRILIYQYHLPVVCLSELFFVFLPMLFKLHLKQKQKQMPSNHFSQDCLHKTYSKLLARLYLHISIF